ncbi:MAG TPA: hypothetical protein VHK91_04680 [Flavisolibacter sp.]|jgi:hypothetical protein|nr:hypothetical protein [Flavisolibacter sp.]
MELTTTVLYVEGGLFAYQILLQKGALVFKPAVDTLPVITLHRKKGQWKIKSPVDPMLREQVLEEAEYLVS